MSSCAVLTQSTPHLDKTGPVYDLTLAVVILYPIFVLVCLGCFYYYRNVSTFLRKRNTSMLIASAAGCSAFWSVTVLFDYIGAEQYPCGLAAFLNYAAIPFSVGPILAKNIIYSKEVALQRLKENPNSNLTGNGSLPYLLAHLSHVAFPKRSSTENRMKNANFALSSSFWMFWVTLTFFPYFIAFFINLAVEPGWYGGCLDCELSLPAVVFLIVLNSVNSVIAVFALGGRRSSQRDPLSIFRECMWGIVLTMMSFNLALVLFVSDPGGWQARGYVNWRSLGILSATLCIYVQTVHQLFVAVRKKHEVLTSAQFDIEDRFKDVRQDREMRSEFMHHLHAELSGETLGFLEAVESLKTKVERDPASLPVEAETVFHRFIERSKAPLEVNIPSAFRAEVTSCVVEGRFSPDMFDKAYLNVKNGLLQDGFARFLARLNKKGSIYKKAKRVTTVRGQVEDDT